MKVKIAAIKEIQKVWISTFGVVFDPKVAKQQHCMLKTGLVY